MANFLSELAGKPALADAGAPRDAWAPVPRPLTPFQWLICGIACLGFAFDLYETLMTALTARPVLSSLENLKACTPEVNLWFGLSFFPPGVACCIFSLL